VDGKLEDLRGTSEISPAESANSRRLVDSAVISKSSHSDFKAGMCACAAPTAARIGGDDADPNLLRIPHGCDTRLNRAGPR
jgi:hypothetical protein